MIQYVIHSIQILAAEYRNHQRTTCVKFRRFSDCNSSASFAGNEDPPMFFRTFVTLQLGF